MYDIIFIQTNPTDTSWNSLKTRFPTAKKAKTFNDARKVSLTDFFWVVWDDVIVADNFEFDYIPDTWSKDYVHVFLNGDLYNGIALVPKHVAITQKEIEHRFFVNKKEIDIVASTPIPYEYFEIDSYNEYLDALNNSKTTLFWMSSANIKINEDFNFNKSYDINQTHAFIHRVAGKDLYNGLFLCSKNNVLTQKEVEYRFPIKRLEWDSVASGPAVYDHFYIDSYSEYLEALEKSKTELFWADSHNIKSSIPDMYFTHDNEFDRTHNHNFLHVDGKRNGLFLLSKHAPITAKEIEHRFVVNAKEWNIVGSTKVEYPVYEIDNYNEYVEAVNTCKTEMFWMSSRNLSATIPDMYFTHDNEFDRKQNHAFIHRVGDRDLYNGVFLCSKHRLLTQKEVEHRYIVNRKEWDIVASGPCQYEIFYPKVYEDYLDALRTSKTEMFWIVPDYVNTTKRFKFDTYFSFDQTYDREINHTYLNGKYHDGVILCSKYAQFSKREFDYKFIANKKEVNIIVSTPKPYDIVFISYQEPTADEYYKYLKDRFPRAKRIHGIKGIHQAHIAAAKLCETDMVWIVDGDALIDSNFKFDYQVAQWDRETVHVWRSVNPINDLVYGYGGVKLFPTHLTVNMDTSKPDMTTSISSKFKAVQEISNTTAFNTDPFNTWKSAFRECVKLSSKVIDRQKNNETEERLRIWQTLGKSRPFGEYAILGATAGAIYGEQNKNNIDALKKINDFEWLKEQFDGNI